MPWVKGDTVIGVDHVVCRYDGFPKFNPANIGGVSLCTKCSIQAQKAGEKSIYSIMESYAVKCTETFVTNEILRIRSVGQHYSFSDVLDVVVWCSASTHVYRPKGIPGYDFACVFCQVSPSFNAINRSGPRENRTLGSPPPSDSDTAAYLSTSLRLECTYRLCRNFPCQTASHMLGSSWTNVLEHQ